MLCCIRQGMLSTRREVLEPVHKALVRRHAEYCVQLLSPALKNN